METLTTDTVRTTESICPTLSCIDAQDIDEVSKEKEEELLYGADEDDALSDDSLRLRVSDDEDTVTGEVSVPVISTDEDEKSKNLASESTLQNSEQPLESGEIGSESKEQPLEKTVCASERAEEADLESGNVLTRERIMSEPMRNRQARGGGVYGSPVGGQFLISRMKGHDNRRRFSSIPHIQPYHPDNRPPYTQQRFISQNNHYRTRSEHYWNEPAYYTGFGGPSSYKYGRYSGNGHDAWSNRSQKKAKDSEKKPYAKPSAGQNESHAEKTPPSGGSVKTEEIEVKEEVTAKEEISVKTDEPVANTESNGSEQTNEEVGDVKADENNIGTDENLEGQGSLDVLQNEHNNEEVCTDKSNDESSSFKASSDKLEESSEKSSEENSCTDTTNEELPISNSEDVDKDVKIHPTELGDNSEKGDTVNDTEEMVETRVETLEENVVECNSVQNDSAKNKDDESSTDNVENNAQDIEASDKIADINAESDSIEEEKKVEESAEVNENKQPENSEMEVETDTLKEQEKVESIKDSEEVSEIQQKETTPVRNDETSSPKPESINNKEETKEIGCLEKLLTTDFPVNSLPNKVTENSSSEKAAKSDEESSLSDENEKQQQTDKSEIERVESSKKKKAGEQKVVNVDSDTTDNPTSTDDSSSANRGKSLPASVEGEAKVSDNEKKNSDGLAVAQRRKRRSRRITIAAQEAALREDVQGLGNGRQKRKTAKNAAEIIRKRFLNHDSDLESSDGSEKFVKLNPKPHMKENARSLSPPSLKRPCSENDNTIMNGNVKKPKTDTRAAPTTVVETLYSNVEKVKNLNYARKFFQRDFKERLQKLKQEEFEELLIQMIAEVITNRSEMGKLREQARVSMKNQEALRTRCQQLAKQIKDLEMVLNRNAADRQANNNKPTAPIKINRSVGLQVNIVSTEYGIQNLRQIQNNTGSKTVNVVNNLNTSGSESSNSATNTRRGLKVRSPRRSESSNSPQAAVVSQSPVQNTSIISTVVTPTALVVTKPPETQHNITLPAQPNNVQKILPVPQQQQQQQQQQQGVLPNGKIPTQPSRQSAPATITKVNTSDLIDLTDEEEKSKSTVPTTKVTTPSTDKPIPVLPKPQAHAKPQQQPTQPPQAQPCYQRVIQAIPASVAISSQPSIRVVQPTVQPTPTALVNNMNAPRLTYVMQSSGPTRQLLITSNSNQNLQIRPVASSCRPPFTTVTYKTGIQTIANGTVRVLTTPATPNVPLNKHPAPLPDTPNYTMNPGWKLPPPAPSLKISKHASGTQKGIVLSWDMALSDQHAEIVSYQLYAYQEISGVLPSTALWKKVGDVRALPLPMACTLTQFSEGNNYYFAVRAVDSHSRKGKYSAPGNISL